MWHEARKQERKIRGLMVDYKKRAERRREFYEKIKLDPTQFLRIYGRPCKINLDQAVALAAESPQSMMPWQGQTDNMIDRFDVRAHLDYLPHFNISAPPTLTRSEEEEERLCCYERYRTLVENECSGLTEEQCLQQIAIDEQFGAANRAFQIEEEKRKLAGKKAAIGYTYSDSTPAEEDDKKEEDEESDDSSDTDVEVADLDITLDVDTLNSEQLALLNQCAQLFGMKEEDYTRLLSKDKEEIEALRQAKMLEEEKAQFAGRKSRRERRAYKEKRLAGRKLSPPSYAARDSPKYEPYRKRSSSSSKSRSRSRSRSPEAAGKVLFITSFGADSEEEGTMHGPALPPKNNTDNGKSQSKRQRHTSWEKKSESKKPEKERNRRPRSRSRSPRGRSPPRHSSYSSRAPRRRSRSRSRSRDRDRSGYHAWGRQGPPRSGWRGRESNNRDARDNRSRRHFSPSRGSKRRRSGSSSSSSRSRSRKSRSRSRSRKSRSRSRSRKSRSRSLSRRSRSRSRRSRSRGSSHSSSRSSSSSKSRSRSTRSRSVTSKSRSPSPSPKNKPEPVVKRYRRESLSSSRSSDSDSEEGNKERDKNKQSSRTPSVPAVGKLTPLAPQVKLTAREKLKKKMQAALSRQYKADKKAEVQRLEKMERERVDREEELRLRALEMRRKERERRHKERERENSSSDERSKHSPPPRRRRSTSSNSRSPSPTPAYRHRKRRSRSRSRSRERERNKLVSY